MKILNTTIVSLIFILLSACDNNQTDEVVISESVKQTTQESDSKSILNNAIKSLSLVDEEFHWRDTHLIIQESQKALNDGKLELSKELAEKAIQQTKLMNQQKEFADKNWKNLIPNK